MRCIQRECILCKDIKLLSERGENEYWSARDGGERGKSLRRSAVEKEGREQEKKKRV